MDREREIYRVTIGGSIINVVLLLAKFAAGFFGHSAAMIADAVHSLTDFVTDVVVLLFVRLGSKPVDKDHGYGHGKYETLATAIIGASLLAVGVMILCSGLSKTWHVISGETLPSPGYIALAAAVSSILLKEWAYRFTIRVGRKYHSEAVVGNAWHHRSDALSSVGTTLGIGGAILLGNRWTVLDPLASLVVSLFIVKAAWELLMKSIRELTDASLPVEDEAEIVRIASEEPGVSEIHNVRTRRVGNRVAIELHARMLGTTPLYEAHQHASAIESRLRAHFGPDTHVGIHLEPIKEK